jgi:hypothetical protein
MQFERKITEVGGSIMLLIPADLAKFLELKHGDIMVVQDDTGKHGKFLSAWKKGIDDKKNG